MAEEDVEPLAGDPGDSPLSQFLSRFWEDREAGLSRGIREYLDLFPGDDDGIVREYVALLGRDEKEGRIGPYEIIRKLAIGGQGVVYLARDPQLDRVVALKVLTASRLASLEALRRFRREVEVISALDHPGLCGIYDSGFEQGAAYIAMPYIRGESLAARIAAVRDRTRGESTTWDENLSNAPGARPVFGADSPPAGLVTPAEVPGVVEAIEGVARALHAAHEAGVVHRDVKPGNIMISTAGEPIVLDFGFAGSEDSADETLTRPGDFFGTAPYMSPEQLAAQRITLDRRTDVYSLGVTLYEAVTSRPPFTAPTRVALYQAIMTKDAAPVRRLNSAVPVDLEVVVHTAMEKDRDRRYQSALEFADDLRRVLEHQPILARKAGPLLRAWRWAQRNTALAISLAALLLVLVSGLVTSLVLLNETRRAWDSDRERHELAQKLQRQNTQLADDGVLRYLEQEDTELWPPRSEFTPRMEIWIQNARELLARNAQYEQELLRLRSEKPAAGSEAARGHQEQIELFERLTAGASTLPKRTRRMGQRLEFARTVYQRTIEDYRGNWRRITASDGGSPIPPQLGLVPVGRDPASGRHEFAVLQSGDVPTRDAEGRLAISEDSAIILVLLPGGSFRMGSPATEEGRRGNEKLASFSLAPFFIGKYEVSQAQWLRVMNNNPSTAKPGNQISKVSGLTLLHPVEDVTWQECQEFVRRLGLVLPTEAQWEYACRAGGETPHAFGPDVESLRENEVNLADAALGDAMDTKKINGVVDWNDGHIVHGPINAFRPNRYGLVAMPGNVSEWCRDHYQVERGPVNDHPEGLDLQALDSRRVVRGGGWHFGHPRCRCARRDPRPPDGSFAALGLRVASPVIRD